MNKNTPFDFSGTAGISPTINVSAKFLQNRGCQMGFQREATDARFSYNHVDGTCKTAGGIDNFKAIHEKWDL